MVAIEDENCPNFVTYNLEIALQCGAIPIVLSVNGHPNYSAQFGSEQVPLIDASQAGWLRRVHRIMRDDSYYAAFVSRLQGGLVEVGPQSPPTAAAETSNALPADSFHCEWHNARLAGRRPTRLSLEPCVACENFREDAQSKRKMLSSKVSCRHLGLDGG